MALPSAARAGLARAASALPAVAANITHACRGASSTAIAATAWPTWGGGGTAPAVPAAALQRRVHDGAAAADRPLPRAVKIVEVGPRDGLQNEKTVVPAATKLELIHRLGDTGLRAIEATSFVSAKWVPQMGDATEVMRGLKRRAGVSYSALTPNLKGVEAAIEAGVEEVAIFGAASDSFSMRNINCNVMDSFERFKPVVALAKSKGVRIRGYVSCVLGCPYEGYIAPDAVGFVAAMLLELGCYEISLGDTIGAGTPLATKAMLAAVRRHAVPVEATAVHFHNTYGAALANVYAALELSVAAVDASVGGLGGCPYARGASGNVPSEDVVYMLHGMGIETGVDLDALTRVGDWICGVLQRPNQSKAGAARAANRRALEEAEAAAAASAAPPPLAAATPAAAAAKAGDRSLPAAVTASASAPGAAPAAGRDEADLAKKAAEAAAKVAAELRTRRIAMCWPAAPPGASFATTAAAVAGGGGVGASAAAGGAR